MNLGTLPTGWEWATLAAVAARQPNAIVDGPFGSSLKLSDYVETGVPVLQGKNITNDRFRWFDVRFISETKANELRRSATRVGDILMIKIGSIGYSAVVESLYGFEFAIIPANLAKLTPDSERVDTNYLHHWMRTSTVKTHLQSSASKTAQPALSLGKIRELPLPLPPLPEQRRIAAILDQADALRAKRREALAQLNSLTQSIFIEMFGDPRRHPPVWPLAALKSLGRVTTGRTPPSSKEGMFGGVVPFITPGDLDSGEPAKRTLSAAGADEVHPVRAGAALVCCIGTVGKMAMAKARSGFNQQINAVDWSAAVDDTYGLAALRFLKDQLSSQATSTTVPILNKSAFEKFEIQVPPLSLQQTFAARVQAVQALKANHRAALIESDALFSSIQDRAFAGRL